VPYIDAVYPAESRPLTTPSIDDADLGPEGVVLLLRSRATSAEVVAAMGRNRKLMRSREVKVAFVSNPRAPQVLARQVLPHLGWRDLSGLAVELRISPILRREAEKLLKIRLPELALGEKIALARRGSRGILGLLADDAEGPVLRAVLGNPRATEADCARILARSDLPATFLGWLATSSSWAQRRGVRLVLVRHPRTPPSAALRLVRALSRKDVLDLWQDVAAPRLVRVAAERHLAAQGVAARGSGPRFG
jgi:hypothetical protein